MIKSIYIHCSDSTFGTANDIRSWHKDRGWRDIGYHYVVLNGMITPEYLLPTLDGSIEVGRPMDGDLIMSEFEVGAHTYGQNKDTIAICMIGTNTFTPKQITATANLCYALMARFGLHWTDVFGHYEADNNKTCPNINMPMFRQMLNQGGINNSNKVFDED